MALHIMPAGEPHEPNAKCPCRPRNERYARRSAWKHNAAKPRPRASGTVRVEVVCQTAPFPTGVHRHLAAAVAAMPRVAR